MRLFAFLLDIAHFAQIQNLLFIHFCLLFQIPKKLKKPVDKAGEKCYNRQAVTKRDAATGQNEKYHGKS